VVRVKPISMSAGRSEAESLIRIFMCIFIYIAGVAPHVGARIPGMTQLKSKWKSQIAGTEPEDARDVFGAKQGALRHTFPRTSVRMPRTSACTTRGRSSSAKLA